MRVFTLLYDSLRTFVMMTPLGAWILTCVALVYDVCVSGNRSKWFGTTFLPAPAAQPVRPISVSVQAFPALASVEFVPLHGGMEHYDDYSVPLRLDEQIQEKLQSMVIHVPCVTTTDDGAQKLYMRLHLWEDLCRAADLPLRKKLNDMAMHREIKVCSNAELQEILSVRAIVRDSKTGSASTVCVSATNEQTLAIEGVA